MWRHEAFLKIVRELSPLSIADFGGSETVCARKVLECSSVSREVLIKEGTSEQEHVTVVESSSAC